MKLLFQRGSTVFWKFRYTFNCFAQIERFFMPKNKNHEGVSASLIRNLIVTYFVKKNKIYLINWNRIFN